MFLVNFFNYFSIKYLDVWLPNSVIEILCFYFFCIFDYIDFEGFLFILRTFEISNGYFYFIHLINFFYFFIYNTDFSLQSNFILSLCFLYFASYFHHILLLFSSSPNISLLFLFFSHFYSSSSLTLIPFLLNFLFLIIFINYNSFSPSFISFYRPMKFLLSLDCTLIHSSSLPSVRT